MSYAEKQRRRSAAFTNDRWEPAGPTLALRKESVAGPFGFFNPTTALYDIQSNDLPGSTRADLADITNPERGERAKVRWNARDYRKGRHILVLPRAAPLTSRLRRSSKPQRVLIGLLRMVTMFPYWDVSWLVGVSFTVGCLIFVACGLFYWLPIAYPETEFPYEKTVAGGVSAFVGATLFQIGAFLLFLEAYNDRAETKFGGALEHLFVERLGIARRVRNHRPKHFHAGHIPKEVATTIDGHEHLSSVTSAQQVLDTPGSGDGDGDGADSAKAHKPTEKNPFGDREWQWLPKWNDVKTHYIYEIGFLASMTMSLGATIFYICGILALPGIFSNLSEAALQGAYYFPYLLGGILFAVSSLLYILETQPNWYTPQPYKIGWHVGVWNFVGGVGWTLAASLGYCKASWCEYQSELTLIWASAAFAFGGAMQWYESLDKYVIIIED